MADGVVLTEADHKRLIEDIEYIASMARVPVSMLRKSSADLLTPMQTAYLLRYRKLRAASKGDAYIAGAQDRSPETTMMAMASVMIRNFIDARVYPLMTVLGEDADVLAPTVLFLPNFYNVYVGKPLASHQLQRLYSVLLDRAVHDKVTIVYVENVAEMTKQYGAAISEFITKNYAELK